MLPARVPGHQGPAFCLSGFATSVALYTQKHRMSGALCTQNHKMSGLLCLGSSTLYRVFGVHFCCLHESVLHFLWLLNNIPFYGYNMLFIHSSGMDFVVIFKRGHCESWGSGWWCSSFGVDMSFCFSWVCTRVGLLCRMVTLLLICGRVFRLFSRTTVVPPSGVWRFSHVTAIMYQLSKPGPVFGQRCLLNFGSTWSIFTNKIHGLITNLILGFLLKLNCHQYSIGKLSVYSLFP